MLGGTSEKMNIFLQRDIFQELCCLQVIKTDSHGLLVEEHFLLEVKEEGNLSGSPRSQTSVMICLKKGIS